MDAKKEEWRDVVGYEGRYKISNKGNCYSIKHHRNLVGKIRKGYSFIPLEKGGD